MLQFVILRTLSSLSYRSFLLATVRGTQRRCNLQSVTRHQFNHPCATHTVNSSLGTW